MPTRINGIGTTYLGKDNLETYSGVCEFCDQQGVLRDYETRLWFTVLYIPILPLGKKQILGECPYCRRHRVAAHHEWQQVGEEAVQASAAELAAKKDDPQAAIALHGTYVSFQKTDDAEQLAQAMKSKFADNVGVYLYLGSWYEYRGRAAESDACFRKAYEIDPENPNARRAYGLILAEEGRLDDARQTLAPLQPPSEHYDPAVFYSLATNCQAHQEHDQALELFRMLLRHNPELGKDRNFRKSVRRSEQFAGGERSLVASDSFFKSKAFLGAAAAVLIVLILCAVNAYIAGHRKLYVVNGLEVPISVELDDGQTLRVPATGFRLAVVAEGDHVARVTNPDDLGESVKFSLTSGWFKRFFDSTVYILDPGQTAATIHETTFYSDRHIKVNPPFTLFVARPFLVIDDVDYVFEEFPPELQIKGNVDSVEKSRVGLVDSSPELLLIIKPDLAPDPARLEYLEKHLCHTKDTSALLEWYTHFALEANEIDRCVDFLGSRLERRPLDIEWHRTYQSLAPFASVPVDLIARYDRLLQASPIDTMLLYLRGRLEGRLSKAKDYYDRSIAADEKNAYTWAAIAYQLQSAGEFEQALAACEKAIQIQPEREDPATLRLSLLMALGRYDALETEVRANLVESPLSMRDHTALIRVLAALGKAPDIDAVHQAYADTIAELMPDDPHQLIARSEIIGMYAKRDLHALLAAAPSLNDSATSARTRAAAYLELDDPRRASEIVESLEPTFRGDLDLCVSLAFAAGGDRANAKKWRQAAVDRMKSSEAGLRIVADYLSRGPDNPATLDELRDVVLEPKTKVAVLLALLPKDTQERGRWFEFAEKLNFGCQFPYYFANRLILQARSSP